VRFHQATATQLPAGWRRNDTLSRHLSKRRQVSQTGIPAGAKTHGISRGFSIFNFGTTSALEGIERPDNAQRSNQ